MRYYMLGHILSRLKKEKLPFSRVTFNAFEHAKIVDPPENDVIFHKQKNKFGVNVARIYTEDEIIKIIGQVRGYAEKSKA